MPMNNNQLKAPSAASRLCRLPVVRSACCTLSVIYTDTKRSHSNLRAVCEVLERSVVAVCTVASDSVSPVLLKLEPQISSANYVACKSLDWLETRFPVLHVPTEEVVATAKNKMHDLRYAVSAAANGTMHTVTRVMWRMQQVDASADLSLAERVVCVACVGLDSALSTAENLVDRMLPPTEEDNKGETTPLVEGFEAVALRRTYPARLVSLTAKLCQRTYYMVEAKVHSVQVVGILTRSTALVQDLQTFWLTLVWSLRGLPQYLQHQVVSLFFFISQTYNLASEHNQSKHNKSQPSATKVSPTHKDMMQVPPQASPTCRIRPPKIYAKGCLRR